jgi:dipeptidyl aminopeptidase/acylaminoacyl peptidase
MKKLAFLFFIVCLLFSCDQPEKKIKIDEKTDFSNQLTQNEIAGGRMTPEILWKFSRLGGIQISPDMSTVLMTVTKYDYKTNKSKTSIFSIPSGGGDLKQLGEMDGFHPRWRPDGKKIGFLSSKSGSVQMWEMDVNGKDPFKITDIEKGINSFEYSPDGSRIYYLKDVKMDPTPQEIYPDLPKTNVRIIDDLMYRHWNHWEDYAYSHIFVADYKDGNVGEGKDVLEGEPFDTPLSPYFDDAEISWSKDGNFIAYTCKKLKGAEYAMSTNSDIYLYNLKDGSTVNITKENPGYDKYPVFSPDNKIIAYESMETPGYESDKNRLFLYHLDTGEKEYLTADFDQNVSSLTWTEDGNGLFFISGTKATFQLYEMDLRKRNIRQITEGDHNYTQFTPAGESLIGVKMTMSMASEIFSVDAKTGKETQLSFINKPIYDKIEMGKVEKRWVKTTDNKDMLVWVIYPPGFDPQKKYPALLYCQGGPQSAVSQFFSYRWNFQMMAANDYIIVAPNRRGLPTFGQEWNAQISGDYGGQNMKDYFSAIDALKKEPFIDENRLGAVGASYGGFSVYWLAGHHQKRFKAFISHCGIFDFESMYTATEETFFVNHDLGGSYWDKSNKIAQRSYANSPHKFVQNWDTPILIITGGNDFRIPYTQSLEAFNAARLRGIPARLLYFPDESHFVTKPQNSILWQREFFAWLDKYLK